MSSNGSSVFFEVALPLNDSDDQHDFNLFSGDLFAIGPVSVCDGVSCMHSPVASAPVLIVVAPFVAPVISSITPER